MVTSGLAGMPSSSKVAKHQPGHMTIIVCIQAGPALLPHWQEKEHQGK